MNISKYLLLACILIIPATHANELDTDELKRQGFQAYQEMRYQKALSYYLHIPQESRSDTDSVINIASSYIAIKEPAKAKAVLDQAIPQHPSIIQLYFLRIKATNENDSDLMISDYLKILQLDPNNTIAMMNLTRVYKKIGDDDKAQAMQIRLTTKGPVK